MLKIAKDSRGLYLRLQIITGSIVVIGHWIVVLLNIWKPPEAIPTKVLLYFGVPFILFSLYFTSFKKIFPQRLGDAIHGCSLILLISIFGFYYGGGIGGDFIFLFLLLIAFSTLLLDSFIPLFIGGLVSLIIIGEFLLTTDLTHISYTPLIRSLLQVMALLIVGWVSSNLVKRTITEQKTSQQLQKAYAELKKLDVAKSEFISIASHQLRTPLTAIKGYISMILGGSYGKLSEKAKKPIESVYKSNERLIKLVNDLLSVSRIEAGKIELEPQQASLEDIITNVVEELKIEAKEKNIYLKWERPKRPLPKILIDRDKIRQAILNVVDNAIRYTEKGGVMVRVELVEKVKKVRIIISDTGVGMTKDELSKMFESFSRGMAGTRLYTEGVGLGLYIARRFVEMHNGKIWAESKGKGKGSRFYIELPIK